MPTHPIDAQYAKAIQEAYASAPVDETILQTIELRHPGLTVGGVTTPLRLIRDTDPRVLRIPAGAPVGAGQDSLFNPCHFELKLSEQRDGSLPELDLQIDNVAAVLAPSLDMAVESGVELAMTYREYLASDPTTAFVDLNGFTIQRVRADIYRVTCSARLFDLINATFLDIEYRVEDFPGLANAA